MSAPRVRVGVVSWNSSTWLTRCLGALPAALGDLDAEVVVVDNASEDDSVEVARAFDGVRVVANTDNRGYARGMNQALAGPEVDVLIALNPDTIAPPGSLARLVDRLLADERHGLVAPLLRREDGTIEHSAHAFPSLGIATVVNLLPRSVVPPFLRDRWWLDGAVRPGRVEAVDWVVGAVHVLRRAALAGPPYDERWFLYVEDLDLCWRLRQAGYTVVFDGTVEVLHAGNQSGRRALGGERTRRWLRETFDWYGRTHGPLAVRAYASVGLLGVAARAVGALLMSRPGRARRHLVTVPTHARTVVFGPQGPAPAIDTGRRPHE